MCLTLSYTDTFKEDQKKYKRVKAAYLEKEEKLIQHLENFNIDLDKINIYLRAFKSEGILEVWAKNKSDEKFQRVYEFAICQPSGSLGPKRKQGDYQVPEGFYHINRFNPVSSFHLSVGINYPNKSDKILSDAKRPGGDIFIHGTCMTVGCLPMTDDIIKELYILCVESKNNGQNKIPVTIFPMKFTAVNINEIIEEVAPNEETISLWKALKTAQDIFNKTNQLPTISFLDDGGHLIFE